MANIMSDPVCFEIISLIVLAEGGVETPS